MLENITGNKLFDQQNQRMEGVDDLFVLLCHSKMQVLETHFHSQVTQQEF